VTAAVPDGPAYRDLSLWHDQHPGGGEPRPSLPRDTDVDAALGN